MKLKRNVVIWLVSCLLLLANISLAQTTDYRVDPSVKAAYDKLSADPKIQQGLEFIKSDDQNTLKEQKEICEITSPPFKEQVRAENYLQRLIALGLKDVQMDQEGNVLGVMPGTSNGPKLVVAAHLDTVFPAGTDTAVKEKDGKLYAPGIADDTRGLAALLSVVRAFNETGIKPVGDIIFCGNVGEEGLGDLRGVKAIFRDNKNIDGFISIDGASPTEITYLATGSHRYQVTFYGPGGHSFGAFGLPSAIHALGRAITHIGDLETPKQPKTTFTVGTIKGGTSVNAIAGEATMLVDMRSNSAEELNKIDATIQQAIKLGATEENARWNSDKITVDIKMVGDRPAGSQPDNAVIVQSAWAATLAIGKQPSLADASSTDTNLPVSLGIPAITIGGGGIAGAGHSINEWYDPTEAYYGPQRVFMTILGLVGVDGVSDPLLVNHVK